jgi:hypothetical protein
MASGERGAAPEDESAPDTTGRGRSGILEHETLTLLLSTGMRPGEMLELSRR